MEKNGLSGTFPAIYNDVRHTVLMGIITTSISNGNCMRMCPIGTGFLVGPVVITAIAGVLVGTLCNGSDGMGVGTIG